jgi:hypothetical protein
MRILVQYPQILILTGLILCLMGLMVALQATGDPTTAPVTTGPTTTKGARFEYRQSTTNPTNTEQWFVWPQAGVNHLDDPSPFRAGPFEGLPGSTLYTALMLQDGSILVISKWLESIHAGHYSVKEDGSLSIKQGKWIGKASYNFKPHLTGAYELRRVGRNKYVFRLTDLPDSKEFEFTLEGEERGRK